MYVYYCRTYEKAVSGGGERALDLRRGYATSFPPNQVNDSKKGSNGPAGSRSGKETLDRRRGYVTSFPPNQVNDSKGGKRRTCARSLGAFIYKSLPHTSGWLPLITAVV